jgi:hypothetical protein
MGDQAIVLRTQADIVREDFMPVFTPAQAVERKKQINQFIEQVLKPELDYGTIAGVNSKPVLLKPGAEKLCSIFGLAPCYESEEITEDWTGAQHDGEPFFYYRYKCRLFRAERCLGEAVGSANSWESKYRYRDAKRVCPECGQTSIIAGKQEYGGGWLCWKKQGGCGFKFEADDKRITEQPTGRTANPDVADQVNTIQKMAQKRALVAAVLVVTNCSDAFTQDLEDIDTGGTPKNTQAAADAVAQRKMAEGKAREGNSTPEVLRPYFAEMDENEQGSFSRACTFVQDEMVKAGGVEQGSIFTEHGRVLRKAHPKGIPSDAGKRFLRVMWGEVERLRKAKAERQRDEADSAMGVTR